MEHMEWFYRLTEYEQNAIYAQYIHGNKVRYTFEHHVLLAFKADSLYKDKSTVIHTS